MSNLSIDSENSSGASCTNILHRGTIFASITGRWTVPSALQMKEKAHYTLVSYIALAQGEIGPDGASLENNDNETVIFEIGSKYDNGYQAYFIAGTNDYNAVTNIYTSPGDTIYANICFGEGSLFMALANETTNTAFSIGFSPAGFEPNWAGWIVGVPELSNIGLGLDMAKYGAVVFDEVTATLSNNASIAPQGTISYGLAGLPPILSQGQIKNNGSNVVCEYIGAYPS